MDRSGPASFYLCLTHECPYQCSYCSLKDMKRFDDSELSTEEWKNIIKDIQGMGVPVIGFTGGEPLLRKDLIELIKCVDKRSVLSIFTTGIGLSYHKARELKLNGVHILGISIPSNFEDLERTNKALLSMKISMLSGLHTVAHIVALKKDVNEENLNKLFDTLYLNGVKEIRVFEPILSGKLMCIGGDEILHDTETREELRRICVKVNNKFFGPKISLDPYAESHDKFGCGAGTNHSYISAYGQLFPCDFLPIPFGNVREMKLKDLWEEMSNVLKKPQRVCLAQVINKQIKCGNILQPKDVLESSDVCKNHQRKGLPDIYDKMKGNK